EGAGPELHPTLEQADDVAAHEQLRDLLEQPGFVDEPPRGGAGVGEEAVDLLGREAGSEEAPFLGVTAAWVTGLPEELVPDEERRPERAARITRGRLDPDVVERAVAEQAAVRDAVERHTPGQHEVSEARPTVEVLAQPHDDL